MRPSHLCLARQINAIHSAGEPNVGKNHRGIKPTQNHDGKRGFRALTLDDLQIAILEQLDDECAQFSIIFYDQHPRDEDTARRSVGDLTLAVEVANGGDTAA